MTFDTSIADGETAPFGASPVEQNDPMTERMVSALMAMPLMEKNTINFRRHGKVTSLLHHYILFLKEQLSNETGYFQDTQFTHGQDGLVREEVNDNLKVLNKRGLVEQRDEEHSNSYKVVMTFSKDETLIRDTIGMVLDNPVVVPYVIASGNNAEHKNGWADTVYQTLQAMEPASSKINNQYKRTQTEQDDFYFKALQQQILKGFFTPNDMFPINNLPFSREQSKKYYSRSAELEKKGYIQLVDRKPLMYQIIKSPPYDEQRLKYLISASLFDPDTMARVKEANKLDNSIPAASTEQLEHKIAQVIAMVKEMPLSDSEFPSGNADGFNIQKLYCEGLLHQEKQGFFLARNVRQRNKVTGQRVAPTQDIEQLIRLGFITYDKTDIGERKYQFCRAWTHDETILRAGLCDNIQLFGRLPHVVEQDVPKIMQQPVTARFQRIIDVTMSNHHGVTFISEQLAAEKDFTVIEPHAMMASLLPSHANDTPQAVISSYKSTAHIQDQNGRSSYTCPTITVAYKNFPHKMHIFRPHSSLKSLDPVVVFEESKHELPELAGDDADAYLSYQKLKTLFVNFRENNEGPGDMTLNRLGKHMLKAADLAKQVQDTELAHLYYGLMKPFL